MRDTELIAPIGYGGPWMVIGILLLVLVVTAILLLLLLRRRSRPSAPREPMRPGGLQGLKADYHERVSVIERDFAQSTITARQAHHRLSAVVRSFGRAVTGIDAPVMTLTELQSSSLPQITVAVAEYYPASFEPANSSEIASSVLRARQVIESWG